MTALTAPQADLDALRTPAAAAAQIPKLTKSG